MVYGYDEKIKDRYVQELRNLIYNAVLQSNGQAIDCVYTAYKKTSRYVKFIINSIMCDKEVTDGDIKVFEKVLASYGDAITYTSTKETIKDERQLLKKGQINQAELVVGIVYKISISQKYAQEIYNTTFGKESVVFKKKLLSEHIQTLEQITRTCNLGKEYKKELYNLEPSAFHWFCIQPSGINQRNECEFGEDIFDFTPYREFGMKGLSNVQQCYGMALALVDVLKDTIWAGKNVDIKIRYNWHCKTSLYASYTEEWIRISYDFGTRSYVTVSDLQDW